MTAFATAENAVQAMKLGAHDYVLKPFKVEELRLVLEKALEHRALVAENRLLRHQVGARRGGPEEILGDSPPIREVRQLVEKLAPTRTTVLVTGESGTGKEVVARSIHGPQRPARPALRGHQLRRHPRGAHRERALRPREGELHRRGRGEARALRGGRVGNALPRRGRGAAAARAGEAPAGAPGEAHPAGGRKRRHRLLGPRHRRHQPGARGRGEGRALPRGPLLPAERHPAAHAAPAGAAGRHPGLPRVLPAAVHRRAGAERGRLLPRRRSSSCSPGSGRATSASSPTWWSAPRPSPTTASSGPRRCPRAARRRAARRPGRGPHPGIDLQAHLDALERRALEQALERTGGNKTEAAKLLALTFRSLRYRLAKFGIGGEG